MSRPERRSERLIRLLARLQKLGTVPVIDYDIYSKILSV